MKTSHSKLYKIILIDWLGDELTYGYMYFENENECESYVQELPPIRLVDTPFDSSWKYRIEDVTDKLPIKLSEV